MNFASNTLQNNAVIAPGRLFSSVEVCRLSGLTPRCIQWWDEKSVLVPARHAGLRRFSKEQAIEACVIADLRHKGLSLQWIRTQLQKLRRWLANNDADGSIDYLLITDGHDLLEIRPALQTLERICDLRKAVYVVPMSEHVRRVNCYYGSTSEPERRLIPRTYSA